jgi:hypothetical protein
MKRTTTLVMFCMAIFFASARTGKANPPDLSTPATLRDSINAAIPGFQEMLHEILEITGLQEDFILKEAPVANLEASILHRKRYINYNANYLNAIVRATGDKWGAMALIAHEVGHHLNGHTIQKTGSSPEVELQADEFAGFILGKLGAPLEKATLVMNYIATVHGSATHPSRMERINAMERGWKKARGM